MPPNAPRPADHDDQATVPAAVTRTLNARSAPPAAEPVPGAKEKLAAAMQVEPTAAASTVEDTLAETPELIGPASTNLQVWIWAAVGAVVALALGALLLI